MEMHGIVWAYILVLILKNLDISRFMEIYRITKPGVYLTMPNFIYLYISFVFKGFRRFMDGCYAITTPVYALRCSSNYGIALGNESPVTWT